MIFIKFRSNLLWTAKIDAAAVGSFAKQSSDNTKACRVWDRVPYNFNKRIMGFAHTYHPLKSVDVNSNLAIVIYFSLFKLFPEFCFE